MAFIRLLNNIPLKVTFFSERLRGSAKKQLLRIFYNSSRMGAKLRLGRRVNIALWGKCQFHLGNNVYIRDYCRIQIEDGQLNIGDNTFFNNFCSLNCLQRITIGSDCLFGEGVKIYDHNHNYSDKTRLIREQGYSFGEVRIGNNCWIGSNVVITKGVEIGDNVVIGAHCVIYKDIPSDTLIKSNG